MGMGIVTVSVIIPTLNEEGCISETLRGLHAQGVHQVIVVDGGSSDGTCGQASAADLVLHSAPGRAVQMNCGAARATGTYLLFLHADCALEAGALEEAERRLHATAAIAACFRMTVRGRGLLYRSIDACATARVRLTGLIYGDQGLFLRREDFERLGGFPCYRLMEDLFFSRTLRRAGKIIVVPRRIFVSPRRWEKTGLVRQTLRNWGLTALAASGVHPDRLAEFYPAVR